MPESPIGERIRTRRKLLKLTVRHAADIAGISHASWGRIERGVQGTNNRFTLAKIAEALRCSVAALTGQAVTPAEVEHVETGAYETMRAIVESDLSYAPLVVDVPPVAELDRELDLVLSLRRKCDYAGATGRLPDLVRGLHTAAFGADRPEALRLMVRAQDVASFVVRFLGHPAAGVMAADRAQQAAEALGDPVMLGLAAYCRAHAAIGCGLYERALRLADTAAEVLERYADAPDALPVRGQLLMTGALAATALGDPAGAAARAEEAQQLATHTGETDALWLSFGPTNLAFWQIGIEADGGDPGRAVEIARGTDPRVIESASKQAAYYMDTGRALAALGRDAEAIRLLVTAERLAPQRVRHNPLAVETARILLERVQRNAAGTELLGLAERVGAAR